MVAAFCVGVLLMVAVFDAYLDGMGLVLSLGNKQVLHHLCLMLLGLAVLLRLIFVVKGF